MKSLHTAGRMVAMTLCCSVMAFAQGNDIRRGPRFSRVPPPTVSFSNSSGATIDCAAEGDPLPTVRWITEIGDQIRSDVSHLVHDRYDGSLVFVPFRSEDFRRDVHDTTYRCVASNSIGSIISTPVKVKAALSKSNYEMRFESDKHVIRGNAALLQCPIP